MITWRALVVVFIVVFGRSSCSSAEDCSKTGSTECVQDVLRNLRTLFGGGEEVRSSGDKSVRVEVNGTRADGEDVESTGSEVDTKEAWGVSDMEEGRGHKLHKLVPFIFFSKMSYLFIYGVLAYVIITAVAKAALLKGLVALGLGKLFLLFSRPYKLGKPVVKYAGWNTYDVNVDPHGHSNGGHGNAYAYSHGYSSSKHGYGHGYVPAGP